jgi:hypothetical protein
MKTACIFITLLFFISTAYCQSKLVTGSKHVIFVDIPKNWIQVQNDPIPLFIKPDEAGVNRNTYIYVYGLDYTGNPDMNGWIKGDFDDFKNKNPGIKLDSIQLDLPKLKKADYKTGRYKIITYTFEDQRKQAILVVECKNTIATVVLSTNNSDEFNSRWPVFAEMLKTVNVLGGTVKIEKQ